MNVYIFILVVVYLQYHWLHYILSLRQYKCISVQISTFSSFYCQHTIYIVIIIVILYIKTLYIAVQILPGLGSVKPMLTNHIDIILYPTYIPRVTSGLLFCPTYKIRPSQSKTGQRHESSPKMRITLFTSRQ